MARASVPTLLALDRYAKILGIAPPHFNQGTTGTVFPYGGTCSGLWWQHPWQSGDRVSREDLAAAIGSAEFDIARQLGYWPAPVWITGEEESHPWPKFYQPEVILMLSRTMAGRDKALATRWGQLVGVGRRATSAVSAGAAVVYTDADSDGYSETATITVPAGALTDLREIKVYTAGYGGQPAWEIRPARSKRLTGGNFVLQFYSWQLVPPNLWEAFPTDNPTALDLTAAASRATTVDVYREYLDNTQASCQFSWLPDLSTDPNVLSVTTQDGLLLIHEPETGQVVPVPAAYGTSWVREDWSVATEPDSVKLWYQAGARSADYLASRDFDPLSNELAEAIAWLATARLGRPLCGCTNVSVMAGNLQEDLAMATREQSFYASDALASCPWGTRRGAVMAWQRIDRSGLRQMGGGVI